MNKRHLHHVWVKLRTISSWYFVVGLILSLALSVINLRHNNVVALNLRDKVNQVDQQNGDLEAALRELRTYVYGHMNTNLADGPNAIKPPIQLKYKYERLLAAQNVTPDNSKVYSDAQAYCERTQPQGFYGATRLNCIQDYITSHGHPAVTIKSIPDSLYKFDFVSPTWSPDAAGLSLVMTAIFAVLVVIRLGLEYWLGQTLKHHQ